MPPRRPTLRKSLRAIERAFAEIAALADALSDRVRAAEHGAGQKGDAMGKRRLKLTAKRRAQLKLHGQYIGHLRHLKPAQKMRVKAVKEKRGFAAAIRAARRLAER